MFLAYQRASMPYKRLVVDDFTSLFFYMFVNIFLGGRRHEALAFKFVTTVLEHFTKHIHCKRGVSVGFDHDHAYVPI